MATEDRNIEEGSPPEPLRYQSEAELFESSRTHVELTASSSNATKHTESIWSAVIATSHQWESYNYSLSDLQDSLETMWHHVCWAGLTLDHDDFLEHQRIVNLVRAIKNQGMLTRDDSLQNPTVNVEDGDWWVRLPFPETKMQEVLQAAFTNEINVDQGQHQLYWQNLNTLAAKISAAQVYDLRVSAVWAMRNVLEETETQHITPTMMQVLSMWMDIYGFWFENLATYPIVGRTYWDATREKHPIYPPKSVSIELGKLAIDAGVNGDNTGFQRWRFWRTRLQQLALMSADDNEVISSARALLDRMIEV